MRMFFLFALFLNSLIFFSCGDSDSKTSAVARLDNPIETDALQKRVILIIDISGSLTDGSQRIAAYYAGQVNKILAEDSHLLIYTTEKNTAQPAIVDVKKTVPLIPEEKTNFEAHIWPATIKRTFDIVSAKCKNDQPQSCILDGLKSVRAGLANATKAQETYLLIISDMLECCELGCPQQAKDFVSMKSNLEKSDLHDFQLAAKIPQDHVKICLINQDAKPDNASMIASPEFRDFWKKAFIMVGYSDMPDPGTTIDSFLEMIKD